MAKRTRSEGGLVVHALDRAAADEVAVRPVATAHPRMVTINWPCRSTAIGRTRCRAPSTTPW